MSDPTQRISDLIDGTYPSDLDREAWAWRRVMKVAEEVGEVNEAMLGWLGENPRKGHTHEREDVIKELLDVAVAALGACAHLYPGMRPLDAVRKHAADVALRLEVAIGDRASRADEGAAVVTADPLNLAALTAAEKERIRECIESEPWHKKVPFTFYEVERILAERATAAEAAVERVRALIAGSLDGWIYAGELDAALDPAPTTEGGGAR